MLAIRSFACRACRSSLCTLFTLVSSTRNGATSKYSSDLHTLGFNEPFKEPARRSTPSVSRLARFSVRGSHPTTRLDDIRVYAAQKIPRRGRRTKQPAETPSSVEFEGPSRNLAATNLATDCENLPPESKTRPLHPRKCLRSSLKFGDYSLVSS